MPAGGPRGRRRPGGGYFPRRSHRPPAAPQGNVGRGGAHMTLRQDPRAPAGPEDGWVGSPVSGTRAGCHTETILSAGDRAGRAPVTEKVNAPRPGGAVKCQRNAVEKELKAGQALNKAAGA